MHLVDGHRLAGEVAPGACSHPRGVRPDVARVRHDRVGTRRDVHRAGHGVGLDPDGPLARRQLVLVARAGPHSGNEDLEHARRAHRAHREQAAVPAAEVAHHTGAPGVGRPDREARARSPVDHTGMSAQRLPKASVRSLRDQVQIELAQGRCEAVGISPDPAVAVGEVEGQAVGRGALRVDGRREQALRHPRHADRLVLLQQQVGADCIRMVGAHDPVPAIAQAVGTEQRVGLGADRVEQGPHGVGVGSVEKIVLGAGSFRHAPPVTSSDSAP